MYVARSGIEKLPLNSITVTRFFSNISGSLKGRRRRIKLTCLKMAKAFPAIRRRHVDQLLRITIVQ